MTTWVNNRIGTRKPGMMSQGRVVIGELSGRSNENLKGTRRRKRPERQSNDEVGDPERVP